MPIKRKLRVPHLWSEMSGLDNPPRMQGRFDLSGVMSAKSRGSVPMEILSVT